jgi:cytochrome c-type biogenesis protein CcsB
MTLLIFIASFLFANDLSSLHYLPVQDGGRIKPFQTFAIESLELVYGKSYYVDANKEKKPAEEIVFTWAFLGDHWNEVMVFEIQYRELKKALKLDEAQKYFSFSQLVRNDRLPALLQELNIQLENKEKLDTFFQALQRLSNQLNLFSAIQKGLTPGFLPQADNTKWKTVSEFSPEDKAKWDGLVAGFVKWVSEKEGLKPATQDFMTYANYGENSHPKQIQAEVHYNQLKPFRWAWILLVISLLCYALLWIVKKEIFFKISMVASVAAFFVTTYGFALRVYLTGRPPVSNMYETVIWVAWGTLLFALVFYFLKRRRFLFLASGLVSALCLMLADFAPTILDPSLQPLEPVLRSNLWLTVHVLTITLSYAAFLLSFGLSDLGIFYYLKPKGTANEKIRALSDASYRAIQVGVVLLAAGTILGGVWADYSWGRFWGWDPKETWALIALLGYLALLHARLAGYVKDFGMFAGSIVAFSLVIMAWYGVNFVLGAGLHSYGFGGGGVEYVSGFVFLHILYVIFVFMNRKDRA